MLLASFLFKQKGLAYEYAMTENKPLTEEEKKELLQLWERLSQDQRAAVLDFIRNFL